MTDGETDDTVRATRTARAGGEWAGNWWGRPGEAGSGERLVGHVAALGWLLFLGFPLANTLGGHHSAAVKAVSLTAAGVFVLLYVLVCTWDGVQWRIGRLPILVAGFLVAEAVALTVLVGADWGQLFIFCAAICTGLIPPSRSRQTVVVCAVLCVVCELARGGGIGAAVGYGSPALGLGLLLTFLVELGQKNHELADAREELARLAVDAERARFARDLHDLLGHSLSVIALKADLAGRLLPTRPDDAAREIEEVHTVAREALGEVRDAVSGYRRATLAQELSGAEAALAAAGIRAQVRRDEVALTPEVESTLAWTVREAATNVIRHSRASVCEITIGATLDGAHVRVRDDGGADGDTNDRDGGDAPATGPGNGLAGIAERARMLGGSLDAGRVPDGGGFCVDVTVPLR